MATANGYFNAGFEKCNHIDLHNITKGLRSGWSNASVSSNMDWGFVNILVNKNDDIEFWYDANFNYANYLIFIPDTGTPSIIKY